MLDIVKYSTDYQCQWDDLISNSRNGTFLFIRDYMDYHSERFLDCSFLVFKKGKIEAVLPGNINNELYISHQGLTYGGLITSSKIVTSEVLKIFDLVNRELKNIGIREVIYKPVPHIYHSLPGQEDIYALFLNNAVKIGCNISSAIYKRDKLKFSESRCCGIRKSKQEGVKIIESSDLSKFWEILNNNLSNKYNTKPVHTIEEITLLKSRFVESIKLYLAELKGTVVAGVLLYVMKNVVHVQYISASELGKKIGAINLLFNTLINEFYEGVEVFDLGGSTEQMGNYLNENLIFQKEGFGGRGVVYETYKYILK